MGSDHVRGRAGPAGDARCEACPSGQFSTVVTATTASVCSSCSPETVSTTTRFGDATGLMMVDGERTLVGIRLAGEEPGSPRGTLEMSLDGYIFRPVCSSGFGSHEAAVFCQALGYHGQGAYTYDTWEEDPWRFSAKRISCSAGAETLEGCYGETVGVR